MKLRIVLFMLLAGLLGACLGPKQIDPSKDSINMLQPCKWYQVGCSNAHNAQKVNVPNSQANKNNADANLTNAQATKVASQAEQIHLQNQMKQTKINLINTSLFCTAGFIVVIILLIGMTIAGSVKGQHKQPGED